jgi:hypothetical protein
VRLVLLADMVAASRWVQALAPPVLLVVVYTVPQETPWGQTVVAQSLKQGSVLKAAVLF